MRATPASTPAVLLDLDGTLLDTAPDMVGAMNELRREEGLDPLPERDVLAARAAGMKVFVAMFGYIGVDERPMEWPATGWLETPEALCSLLERLRTSDFV